MSRQIRARYAWISGNLLLSKGENVCTEAKLRQRFIRISCILSVGERNKSIGKYYPKLDIKKDSIFTYNITTNEKCSKCNYSLICGGGCPYHVLDEKGSILCPNCFNLKNEIDYIIPTLYKQLQGD